MGRLNALDAIEGFYLGNILLFFRTHRIFACFHEYADPIAVADKHRFDAAVFSALMDFLYLRTDLFTRDRRKRYRLRDAVRQFYWLEFQIDKFLGAYGPAVQDLGATLKGRDLGRGLVNRQIEAAAYAEIQSPPNPLVLEEVSRRAIGSLVDLGCGPGTLLAELAAADPAFRGWGLDADADMLDAAREMLAKAGLDDRITLIQADARQVEDVLPAEALSHAQAVHCKGLLDEFFRTGDAAAVEFLGKLRRVFPAMILFNIDYYGKLTRVGRPPARYQHTLLHDLLQQLTAQGTPPADLAHWVEIYVSAGCEVLHAYEGESNGIDWFVHVVQL